MIHTPLQTRILQAYQAGIRDYFRLLDAVFPVADYPRAFQCATQGGPPGCAMAFGKALRQLGGRRTCDNTVTIPAPTEGEERGSRHGLRV